MAKLFDKISADFMAAIKGVVESTAAFEKARDEEKKARMSGEDKDKVAKLAAMMSKEKKPVKEAVGDFTVKTISAADSWKKHTSPKTSKSKVPVDPKTGKTLYQKVTSEEAEQVDEKLSDEAKAAIRHAAGGGAKVKPLVKLAKMAKEKTANEEVEQVDELSKATMGRYINKAAERMSTQGVTAGLKIAADEKSKKNFDNIKKREKGIKTAVDKLTKEEIEMIEAKMAGVACGSMEGDKHMCATKVFHKEWNEGTPIKTMHADPDENGLIEWYDVMFDHGIERVMTEDMEILQQESHMHSKRKMKMEDVDQVDESVAAAAKHLIKRYGDNVRKSHVRSAANDLGVGYVALSHHVRKKLGVNRLEEARGRPKKAAAKDFTIHPVTKEKLMHNNPEHMKKIEKLQKHGVLEKPKTEAGQHIINQLRKASTSMQGGATVHFTHGESKHVTAAHAGKALDKYAGMKPSEKEDFQKKISHSHEEMMKHI